MCSLFSITPPSSNNRVKWEKSIVGLLLELGRDYVAPGTEGVVLTGSGKEQVARQMRWGFHRPWTKRPLHNARDDKLDGATWSESFRQRRCLIPMVSFFEWSGVKGRKIKHEISVSQSGFFYAAGMWEETAAGSCFTMITTSPSEQMKAIHDRMPAIIAPEHFEDYLFSRRTPEDLIQPYASGLVISPPPELTLGF